MARPLRIEYAGALYHITSRGNAQEAIYRNDEDRKQNQGVRTLELKKAVALKSFNLKTCEIVT